MLSKPLISVIIPVYNVEKYLHQCLDSIINQTLKEIEIICVDDGSTDKSLEILKEYAKKDKRIIILQQQNQYAGVARNTGLKIAKGKYLSFLDSDDFFELNMLEEMYNKAEQDQSDIVICGWYSYNDKKQEVVKATPINPVFVKTSPFSGKDLNDNLFILCKPNAWTKLYNHEFFLKHNLEFENCRVYNDMTCVYLSLAVAKKISILDKCYVYYRNNQNSNLTSQWNNNFDGVLYAVNQLEIKLKHAGLYYYFQKAFIKNMCKRIQSRYLHMSEESHPKAKQLAQKMLSPDLYNALHLDPVYIRHNPSSHKFF